ncbi:MAG: beta-propeller domain-containing protein [Pirellulaceae bacterium]
MESRQLLTTFVDFYPTFGNEFTVRRDESAPVELNVRRNNYVDGEFKELVPVGVVQAGSGIVSIDPEQQHRVTYQPEPGFVGIDVVTIEFAAIDPVATNGDSVTRTPNQEIQFAVNVVEPLLAVDDWYSIDAGSSERLVLDVLTNDTINANYIGQRSELTVQSVSAGDGILVEVDAAGKNLIYTPTAGFSGVETIQYTAIDRDGYTATGTALIRVDDEPNESLWPEQLQQQLIERAVNRHQYAFGSGVNAGYYYRDHFVYALADTDLAVPTAAPNENTSGTNNQLADVDESDRIKTDGEFLFVLSTPEHNGWMGWDIFPWIGIPRFFDDGLTGVTESAGENMLTVIDIRTPSSPTIVSREIFADKVLSLDLHDQRLTVIGQRDSQTVVSTLDVSDATDVRTISTTLVDGQFKQARRVADSLYVFTDQYGNSVPDLGTIASDNDEFSFYETARQYLDRVSDSLLTAAMPSQQVFDGDGNPIGEPVFAVDPLATGIPDGHWLNILTFDTTSDVGGAIDWDINQGGSTVLVTPLSIYITQTDYQSDWPVIDAIDFIPEPPTISTQIDRYELQADGSVDLAAGGKVPGTLKNSFSLDEHDGSLRIATENTWRANPNDELGSSVYVLQQTDADMNIIGATTGLAPGESIYAVRFAGDRGYVVTFRRVDPLFVLDLSDPTDPQVKGELKVPGYSQYLHVVSDQHVIGVGRDANPETGLYEGLTVSLFNVSNMANPVLQDRYLFDGGRSTFSPFAEGDAFNISDHHAISYFANEGILALPYYSQNYFGSNTGDDDPNAPIFISSEKSAVATFRIDAEEGISTIDNILFDSRADRAMRVGEYLYSLSQDELKVTHLTQPGGVIAALDFERQGADDFFETNVDEEVTVDVVENDMTGVDSTIEILAAELVDGEGFVTLDGNRLRFTPKVGRLSPNRVQYTARDEAGTLINAITTIDPDLIWQNARNRFDINDDGKLTPRDILNVINTISDFGSTDTESIEALIENTIRDHHFFSDSNGDKHITPDDILQVINRIADSRTTNDSQSIEFSLDQPFEIRLNQVGQAAIPSDMLRVSPINVIEDSRCPAGTTCVWEGQVRVELEVQLSGETTLPTLTFRAGHNDAITVGDYKIAIENVSPESILNQSLENGGYLFTLRVTNLA